MSSEIHIFDREILKLKKKRSAPHFSDFDFLHRHALQLIGERVEDITLSFDQNVLIGLPVPEENLNTLKKAGGFDTLIHMDTLPHANKYSQPGIIADEEYFPFGQGALDLVLSNLSLHQTNDLPGALIQIRKALKPDGLFIASLFGGESLWQLREALNHAEQDIYGGLSPRVHPFADKQQMGALMQRAGFALPVVDSEFVTVTYANIFKLMADLRGMGETNIVNSRKKSITSPQLFHKAGEYYAHHFSAPEGQIEATFEIIFLIGWAPSDTQQKPLKPGSAKNRLADALGTDEMTTGEKTGL